MSFLFLMLLFATTVRGGRSCIEGSIVTSSYRIFERGEIQCSGGDLCDIVLLWPSQVSCMRAESKLPSGWSWNSAADVYAHAVWRCESDKTWVQSVWMDCPANMSACNASVLEDCIAVFDPAMSLYYIGIVVAVCLGVFAFFCCAGVCGCFFHCRGAPSRYKPRTRFNYWEA